MGGSGSFVCTCVDGFIGDGVDTCVNINECTVGTDICPMNANCVDTEGSFVCVCKLGFMTVQSNICVSEFKNYAYIIMVTV